jgi:elongation factor P hydroxylase
MAISVRKSSSLSLAEPDKLLVICGIFDGLFGDIWMVDLVGGAEEPLYSPALSTSDRSRIYYRADYLSSLLHEAAHWCLAGTDRRKLEDYGYWYNPDGRDDQQQELFLAAEVKPQALEWLFSVACDLSFRVSMDNLSAISDLPCEAEFHHKVAEQIRQWCSSRTIPSRGLQFVKALASEFGTDPMKISHYGG